MIFVTIWRYQARKSLEENWGLNASNKYAYLIIFIAIPYLQSLIQRLSDRLYGLHKIHGNYGRVFSEWSGIEQEMGDGLQSAGHHMDV